LLFHAGKGLQVPRILSFNGLSSGSYFWGLFTPSVRATVQPCCKGIFKSHKSTFTLAGKDFTKIETVKITLRIQFGNDGFSQFRWGQIILINNLALKMENAFLDDGCFHRLRWERG
jgi:hypothetical protein